MQVFQIIGLGIISTVLIVIIKDFKPEFKILISIATGVIIFSMLLNEIGYVIDTINSLSSRANVDIGYFDTIIKIMGIAYLVEFASQISKDAGENSIAMKIEFGGKIMIMILAIPILMALMDLIIKILP